MLGDTAVARNGHLFEKKKDLNSFTATNFQIRVIATSSFTNRNPDPIARLRNTLITAWTKFKCIPKIIMVIPENDLIKAVKVNGSASYNQYIKAIEWVADEHVKIIDYYKKYTTPKQMKNRRFWPFYLWISASLHTRYEDYSKRVRFNRALDDTSKVHPRMTVLKPSQQWDSADSSLVSMIDRCLTGNGWAAFWNAVDCAVSYFDTKVIPHIIDNKNHKNQFQYRRSSGGRTEDRRSAGRSDEPRRKLPTPPKRQ